MEMDWELTLMAITDLNKNTEYIIFLTQFYTPELARIVLEQQAKLRIEFHSSFVLILWNSEHHFHTIYDILT